MMSNCIQRFGGCQIILLALMTGFVMSCAPGKQWIQTSDVDDETAWHRKIPNLSESAWDMHIIVGKKNFSGIFIHKKSNEGDRFSFLTKLGNKLLDLTLTETDYIVHFAIDQLNKKFILNHLEKDLRLLTFDMPELPIECYRHVSTDCYLWSQDGRGKPYMRACVDADDHISCWGVGHKRQMDYGLEVSYDGSEVDRIVLTHPAFIKLRIELDRIHLEK